MRGDGKTTDPSNKWSRVGGRGCRRRAGTAEVGGAQGVTEGGCATGVPNSKGGSHRAIEGQVTSTNHSVFTCWQFKPLLKGIVRTIVNMTPNHT